MKRFLSLLVLITGLLFLQGCFESTTPNEAGGELLVIKKTPIQISIPKSWREIKETSFQDLGKDILLAYSSLNYSNGFANNISITTEPLDKDYTALEYANANIILSGKNIDDYIKLDEKSVLIKDMDDKDISTKLHTFEARFDRIEKKRKYMQLYAVKNKIGYVVTIVTSIDELGLVKYENILKSFRFVKE